jgi:hypothetical protein
MDTQVERHTELVTVTLGLTTDNGQSTTESKSVPGGATKVPTLKEELGVPAASALWLIDKHGKKKALADHESHHVKEGDHFEALAKGGVS